VLARFKLNYRIRIDASGGRVVTGRPPPAFLHAVRDIARLHSIGRGDIECRGIGAHARLRFSNGFPERGRQAIRNVWQAPSAPPQPPGRRVRG
jgi:hypothetical protein